MYIPSCKAYFSQKEKEYMLDALERGQISGDGYYTEQVSALIAREFAASNVLMTTSGTHALEMAVTLADLMPGDEVIMPSFTYASTANAVLLRGAKPVFAEISPVDLNIDPEDIQRKITPKTKAIIPVHYAGVACDMDSICSLAKSHSMTVIEDAAQGVHAGYRGQYLGTIGDFGCYSFHGTKNYTCGEGGALLINQENAPLIERAEVIRQKGTNRSQFLRGAVDQYNWIDTGSSYSPSDLLMAVLLAQLEQKEEIREKRKAIHRSYQHALAQYEERGWLSIMKISEACAPNYHIFWILLDTAEMRDHMLAGLNRRGIAASFHYLPLHSSPLGREMGYKPDELPITEKVAACLLRLPIYAGMTESEMDYILQSIADVMGEM